MVLREGQPPPDTYRVMWFCGLKKLLAKRWKVFEKLKEIQVTSETENSQKEINNLLDETFV